MRNNHYLFNAELVAEEQVEFIQELLSCKNFENSDRLLGFSKGRGITWFLKTKAELGINIVLRHYYRGGLFGKLVKDSYFFSGFKQTRAYQEFFLLQQMLAWNLPVPRPVAIKVVRTLCCYRADIMLEKLDNTQDLSKSLQSRALSAEQYEQIGKLIRHLHNHQVHHSDLNIHNILLDDKSKFWLIDFDKCRIQKGDIWKKGNLARLLRSFKKEQARLNILFKDEDWQSILKGYLAE
ncbi:3-deoxy-D-manno-octulosonic acid kinase [Mannheimia granulomatis]|uniref:3-deoxy-D-manno-octulosonic acid kinase n=1 Tax=Mannheimia granulomatis TaxID=85402 RepID=UPI00047A95E2|nr:3-deoxy-D-manno-octulosonic acid kinase [Mannheimia granulomatis]QLB18610.1 3-deoxy-D-manno-octulosonic acid kinase [Mannheimia granulomatis]